MRRLGPYPSPSGTVLKWAPPRGALMPSTEAPSIYDRNEALRVACSLCDASLDGFDERMRLQKLVYLAQTLGAFGGFSFSWHSRGPYSPSLASMLPDAGRVGALERPAGLSPVERGAAGRIKSLMGGNLGIPRSLELYASVWYLLPRPEITDRDAARVVGTMADAGPHFGEQEVRACVISISQFRAA